MFDYWLTIQKKLHSEKMLEAIEEVKALPQGSFTEPDTGMAVVRYLNILRDLVEDAIKEDEDV